MLILWISVIILFLKIKAYESEPINAALVELFSRASSTPVGYQNGIFSYVASTYKQKDYNDDLKNIEEAEDPTTVVLTSAPLTTKSQVEAWIKYIDDFGVSGESIAQQQALLQGKKKAADKAAEAYLVGSKEWQVLVDAVSSNGATLKVVPTDKDEENNPSIKTAVKSYNDAITVLGTAITAYNKAYDDLYKKAHDKSITDAKDAKYIEGLIPNIADQEAWNKFNQDKPNATNAEKIAKLEEIVLPAKATEAKKAAEEYVKTNQQVKDAAIAAGAAAWSGSDEETENTKAITDAKNAAIKAFGGISTALNNYATLAQDYYGQDLKENIALEDISGKGAFLTDDAEAAGHKK